MDLKRVYVHVCMYGCTVCLHVWSCICIYLCIRKCNFRTRPGAGTLALVSQGVGGCELSKQVPSNWLLYLAQHPQPIGGDLRIPAEDVTVVERHIAVG